MVVTICFSRRDAAKCVNGACKGDNGRLVEGEVSRDWRRQDRRMGRKTFAEEGCLVVGGAEVLRRRA